LTGGTRKQKEKKKFSFLKRLQKSNVIFKNWVLVFSFMYLVSVDPMDRSQIIKISPKKTNLDLIKMIWIRPKQFGPGQNNFYQSETIWTVQNHFGLIGGRRHLTTSD